MGSGGWASRRSWTTCTQFGIASNSKVFTALALGLLVEEQKIAWDAPVVRYLPWFRLADPYVTRELTIRDLLVHRSGLGLGAGDLLWWPPSTYTRREVAERLQFIPLATSFRSAYAYDNVLYLVAGEVIQAVSGRSWEDFVGGAAPRADGMTSSDVRHSAAGGAGNVAATHAPIDGKVRPVAPFLSDNTNPAGGIMSGAGDMAKWLGVFLARGELPNGTRLFAEATWRQLTTIVTPLPPSTPGGRLTALRSNFRGYGLGLDVRDYRGRPLFTHTGGLPGYVSRVDVAARDRARRGRLDRIRSLARRITPLHGQSWTTTLASRTRIGCAAYVEAKAFTAEQLRKTESASRALRAQTGPRRHFRWRHMRGTYTGRVVRRHRDGDGRRQAWRSDYAKTPALVGDLEHWQRERSWRLARP